MIVVGGGVAGLLAAGDLATAGHPVTLVDSAPYGGSLRSQTLDGLTVDLGAEAFATARPAAADLIAELGLDHLVVEPAAGAARVVTRQGTFPLPPGGMFGIPVDPGAAEVAAVVGDSGVAAALAADGLPID